MAYRIHLWSVLDTTLRVPPLFVMDEVLKSCFGYYSKAIHGSYVSFVMNEEHPIMNTEGFGSFTSASSSPILSLDEAGPHSTWSGDDNLTDTSTIDEDDGDYSLLSVIIPAGAKILMFLLVYLAAIVAFLLNSPRLIRVYLVAASIAVVVASYQANMSTVRHVTEATNSDRPALLQAILSLNGSALWDSSSAIASLTGNYFIQGSLGFLFLGLHSGPVPSVLSKLLVLSYLLPTCCLLLPFPTSLLMSLPVFSALLPLATIKYTCVTNMWHALQVVFGGYQYARGVMRDYGLHSLLESEWVRLNVPNVLRTFWMIRVAQHLVLLLGEFMYVNGEYQSLLTLDLAAAYVIFKAVMTQGCETAVALLGMTSIVSYCSHYIGILFQMVLLTEDDDERSMGTVCAILFFVLAEQSGLTVLEGEKRFVRLCRNFCLLFTAMLHFTHNMVNPVLMSLSASRNPALYRHARALIVCSVLVCFPLLLLWFLWTYYPLSTWLLAVSAFSIQVVVKTIVSLVIYGLFLVDAHSLTFWERLDDYVYYIRAFGNSVEFIFGILLFFNGAWIYFFESGGSIRALMMCVHAYFNIWCEARNGWIVFMKRRTAVNKINSLPEASQEQLENHDDVCAICFQDLSSAKITKCNHYFHSVCLRKWLYVQDSCPLCHETLYKTDQPPVQEDDDIPQENQAGEPTAAHEEPGGAANVEVECLDDDIVQPADAASAPHGGNHMGNIRGGGDESGAGDNREDYMRVAEVPCTWGNNPNIDVILGEDMNRPANSRERAEREVVIDNEVGEALSHLTNDQAHLEHDNNLPDSLEDRQIPQLWLGGNNDNQQMFVLRTRRSHRNPIIDQDIGQ